MLFLQACNGTMLLQEAAGQGWEEDRGGGRWWPGGDRAEEEDGGVSKHFRAAIFFQGAWIFVHPYFHEDQTFLCSTIFTRSKHFLHQHFCKDFHASIFLQEASNFIHTEQKKNLFGEICVWNMWSQAEFFSCRKFLRQYCCHWKFTILYQEKLTDSLNMIRFCINSRDHFENKNCKINSLKAQRPKLNSWGGAMWQIVVCKLWVKKG